MKERLTAKMLKILLSTLLLPHEATCSTLLVGSRDPAYYPPAELEHFPEWFTSTMTPFINGTEYEIPGPEYTPDYRIEEAPFFVYNYWGYLREELRPYRLSPHAKQTYRWPKKYYANRELNCYCTTVYRRLHLLAGCALLTTRHALTTATSTEHILRKHKGVSTLEGILGVWYDNNWEVWNSSMYLTPARIHYHPMYARIDEVNASHPIPCMYDLSLWASTFRVPGFLSLYAATEMCQRAASSIFYYTSTMAQPGDMAIIIGFQFIKAYRRKPLPWYKYGVKTREHVMPCPKTEWGWFHCIMGDWARLGLDSGAGYHMTEMSRTWRIDGLAGINAFSMKLRSLQIVHYFTVLDTYPVLDFLYDATLGKQDYEFLDYRFYNSLWMAPRPKPWEWIKTDHTMGEPNYSYDIPYYKK